MAEQEVTVTLGRVNNGEGYSISVDRWQPVVYQSNDDFLKWEWDASSGLDIVGAKIRFFAFQSRFVGTGNTVGSNTTIANKTGTVKKDPKFRNQNNQYEISIRFRDNGGPILKIRLDPEYRVEF